MVLHDERFQHPQLLPKRDVGGLLPSRQRQQQTGLRDTRAGRLLHTVQPARQLRRRQQHLAEHNHAATVGDHSVVPLPPLSPLMKSSPPPPVTISRTYAPWFGLCHKWARHNPLPVVIRRWPSGALSLPFRVRTRRYCAPRDDVLAVVTPGGLWLPYAVSVNASLRDHDRLAALGWHDPEASG